MMKLDRTAWSTLALLLGIAMVLAALNLEPRRPPPRMFRPMSSR